MTLKELEVKIDEMEKLFVDTAPLRTEYHRKISWSFSVFVFYTPDIGLISLQQTLYPGRS